MTRRRLRFALPLSLACLLLAGGSAPAHEFALESVITGFVKIESTRADVVLRMPLHLLKSASFPAVGREIDLAKAGPPVQRALTAVGREITIRENGRALVPSGGEARLSVPSDRSFGRYEDAVAHIASPAPPGSVIYLDQGYLDLHLTYPISSPMSPFTIRTAIAPEFKDSLKLALRYMPLSGDARSMVITSRSGEVSLNPTWYRAAVGFVALGVAHIVGGIDHLLFLLCLIIPVRGLIDVLKIVTTFTVAHSITLGASAYDLAPSGAWFPPFVETVIAASIVYMALGNILGSHPGQRWLVTALFGLVHGFGFAYGLRESLQFAGDHLLVSLLSFNIGIEIGQILVLAVMLPILALLLRSVLVGRIGIVVLSALVAHVGWHWMLERGDVLWKVAWPRPDQTDLAILARWGAALILLAAVARFIAARRRVSDGLAMNASARDETSRTQRGDGGPSPTLDHREASASRDDTGTLDTARRDRIGMGT